jgi:hypothetical protein
MNNNFTNELIHEKSPYLLQHAHNPVNWYPWNEKSLNKAKQEDKPIFLSIGYSTCHWCHVMERESFEDIDVAKILNDNFVAIKVDREERPDIDSIYMEVCQALNHSGGWPLTIFLTPDQKPFFAGTYFPKFAAHNRPGLIDILTKVTSLWITRKNEIVDSSNHITDIISKISNFDYSEEISNEVLDYAFEQMSYDYDKHYGGFGYAPKFPMPTYFSFLLRYYYSKNNIHALSIVTNSLKKIYKGGIFDHIGFGFSRYSTDNRWLIPHFEKMIYDNALMTIAYTEAYLVTKDALFKKVANDTLSYILRDMTGENGSFLSAEDADSEGIEGKFYTWDYNEIIEILGKEEGEKFCNLYNITVEGNFDGRNIPNLIDKDEINADNDIREKLFDYRNNRIHPHKDDKILTSWNGLVIAALSIAGRTFKENNYIIAAKRAVTFIYNNLFNKEGRLLARYRDKESSILAYAEDYSFLTWGLLELYQSTFEPQYLKKAIKLQEQLKKYFWDYDKGGLFLYGSDSEKLIKRPKEIYDGVMPSANSVATMNWLRLFSLTGDYSFKQLADTQFKTFSNSINNNPTAHSFMLICYMYSTEITKEIIINGEIENYTTQDILTLINNDFNPYVSVLLTNKDNHFLLEEIIPSISNYKKINDLTTAYICSNNTCSSPVTDINHFKNFIKKN